MNEQYYSDKDVLQILGIDNFRQLSKDKAVSLANMHADVKPKTLTKAVKQMPPSALVEFGKMLISTYGQAAGKILDDNAAESKTIMDACLSVLNVYKEKLERDDLTPEEEKILVEQITQIIEIMRQQDKDDKAFRLESLKSIGESLAKALGVVACVAVAANKVFKSTDSSTSYHGGNNDDIFFLKNDNIKH